MRPQSVTVGSATTSAAIPMNPKGSPFNVSIGCVLSNDGNLTYKVQHTFDNVLDPATGTPTWFDHASMTALSANQDGNYAFPVAAIRLNVTGHTAGSVTMTLWQGQPAT